MIQPTPPQAQNISPQPELHKNTPQSPLPSTPTPQKDTHISFKRKKTKGAPSSLGSTPPQPISPQVEQSPLENIQREPIEMSPHLQKVVSKEQDDHVARASTTAFGFNPEQDSSNINKTRPTATSSTRVFIEPDVQEGPWCQETMGGLDAQTRSETFPNISYDPSKMGTPSKQGEDRYTSNELMALCTKLGDALLQHQQLIEHLQTAIAKLNRVVSKLVHTHKRKKVSIPVKPHKKPNTGKQIEDEGSLEALQRTKKPGTAQMISSSSSSSSEDATKKGELIDSNVAGMDTEMGKQSEMETINKVIMDSIQAIGASKAKVSPEVEAASVLLQVNQQVSQSPKVSSQQTTPQRPQQVSQSPSVSSKQPAPQRPILKGISIVAEAKAKDTPKSPDMRPKGIISTKEGPRAVVIEKDMKKGKAILQEPEKKMKSGPRQIELDAELARKLQKDLNEEREQQLKKDNEERELQLKKDEALAKQVLEEEERLLKKALAKEKSAGDKIESTKTRKRMKMKARVGPFSKKMKTNMSSPAQTEQQKEKDDQAAASENKAAEAHSEQDIQPMSICEEEQPSKATPLNIKQPAIIDWFSEQVDNRHGFKIIRADKSFCKYPNFSRMVSIMGRDDLLEMFEVGRIKYANLKEFNHTKLIMEYLKMMFAPEEDNAILDKFFSPVVKWQVYENSGVYSVMKLNGRIEYYLVERKYNHGLSMMQSMMKRRPNACQGSTLAPELELKIARQIHELEELSKSRK